MSDRDPRPKDRDEMLFSCLRTIASALSASPAANSAVSACPNWPTISEAMSNYEHEIDEGMDQALRSQQVISSHSAWRFHGKVWFADGQFHEEVWINHSPRAVRSAATLPLLMKLVNEEFGAD